MAMGSASRPYLELYFVALYALFLTIAPIIVTAINDSDVPKAVAARTPELYTPGIRRVHFTLTGYLRWTADALYAAAVSIFLPCLACNEDKDGAAFFGLHSISWLSMWLLTAGVNVRLFPEISSWSKLEYTSNGFSMFLLVFFGVLMSQVAFPLGTTHTYSWDWYNHFIARFFGVLEWWLTLFLGLFLFVLPVLIGRAWYSVKRPPPPMPPRTEQVRMPSLADVKVEPSQVRNSRVSMMQVPNEQIIEEERQQQEVRKSLTSMSPEAMVSLRELSLVKNAPPSAAASAAPADAPPDPTPRRQSSVPPSPGRGFAFSSSDQTSQHMWEVHNSSSLLRQRSLARGGSITSPGSTPLSERIDSERGRPVMPS